MRALFADFSNLSKTCQGTFRGLMALPATLLIACALAFAAPISAWAIDTTTTLPDTSIAYDASNADYTHRTVVGSGDSNQIVVTNTCNTLPVATNVAVDNVPWIPIAAILAAVLGIVLVINRRAHIEQVSSRVRRFSGKSGAGEPPSPTSSATSIIACLVLAGGLAFSTLGSATGFAIAPSSLKVVNHIEGAFANASHAFPMAMTLYTPADAPSDADYTVSLPDGSTDTIRVTNHASAAYGFALAGDEELDIIGLPVGTVYKFEQIESGSDGLEYSQSISYTTSFVDANLTFAGNEPASTAGEASGLEHPASGACAVGLAYSWTGTPSLEGYAFEGYSADPDATAPDAGLEYGEGKTYSYVVQDEDDALYPVWSANTYAMAYAGMEDATPGASAPTSAAYDETFTVGTPTKAGFTFDGWDITGMDGSVHTYGENQTTASSLSGVAASSFKNLRSTAGTVTFTARWTGPYSGEAYAVIDSDGKMTLFRSNEPYTSSSFASDTKTVRDIRGNEYTGVVCAGVESTNSLPSSVPWYNYRSSIKSVEIADDQAIQPDSVVCWFSWCQNMTTCDLTGLDLSKASSTKAMFSGSDGLVSVDVADLDMSNITDTTEMFYQCTGLETIDVSRWDVGNVVTATKTFYNCPKIQVLDVSDWDTSSMVDMSLLFGYCKSVAVLDVSGFDTSNATNMSGMFLQCYNLASIDVTHFDTSKVNDMSSMFCGCSGFSSLDVTHFDTSKAVNMGGMFNGCSGLTDLDITNFDTSSATSMGGMFLGCSNLATIDVSRFDTSKVTSMTQMFANCTGMTWLDLSNFDMSSAYNTTTNGVYLMFGGSSNLETIYAAPGTNWAAAAGATYSGSAWMFKNNNSLVGGNGTRFNDGGAAYARIDGLDGNPGYFTVSPGYTGTAYAVLTNASDSRGAGHLIFFRAATEQTAGDGQTTTDVFGNSYTGTVFAGVESTEADSSSVPWYSFNSQVMDARVAPMQHIWPASTAYWFYGCSDMASVDLHGLDTSNATSMSYMFRDCSSLASINLAPLDTSNVTNMIHMFYGCSGLTSIDVSGFDTSGIESMSNMFNGCSSLTSLDLSSFSTGNVTSLISAVRNCTNLESLDISSFDTSKVTTERYLFDGCPKLSSVKLGTSFSFDGKGGITYKGILPTPDTSNLLYTGKWVNASVEGAKGVTPSDLADNYDGSAAGGNYAPGTYVWESAFTGNAYAVLDAGGKLTFFRADAAYVDGPDQTVVDSMGNSHTGKVYSGVESTGATASSVPWHGDIASVTSVEFAQIAKPASTAHWFDGAENLTDCVLRGLVTSETSDMSSMFEGCSSLAVLDVSGFNVGALEHAERMFAGCASLSMLIAAEGADWSDGAQAPHLAANSDMFAGCASLDSGRGTTYDAAHQGSDYARLDGLGSAPGYFAVPLTHGIAYAVLTDANDASGAGNMVFFRSESEYSSGAGQTVSDIRGNSYSGTVFTGVESTTTTANSVPWYAEDADILSARVAPAQTIQPAATSNWFRGQEHMTSCDLTGLDTSGAKSMSYMFNGCSALSSLDVSMLDTSHSTSFASMFSGCSGLTSLNLAGFDTQSATTFASMFLNCSSLTSVGFGCFNTSKVTTMANMFSGCTSLTSLDLGSFATPSVTTFSNMLKNCNALSSVVFGPHFNLKGKGNIASSYRLLLPTPTAESTGDNAVTGKWINSSAEGALPVTPAQLRDNWDMTGANPSYAPGTYVWARSTDGTAVAVLDSEGTLTLLRTRTAPTPGANQAVVDLEGNVHTGTVYTGIESTASASGAAPWHADRASVLSATTASGQYVKPVSTAYWFEGCTGLNYLDFSFLDTSATTTMAHMFDGCTSLEAFEQSSSMDVSAVTDMSGMFKNCSSMTYNEIFWWNYTEALLDTSEMFYGCSALDWVDLSLDTSHATDMANMFYGCTSLEYADIGNVFTFRGANIADDSKCALLPNPPTTAPYYGTWVNTSVEGAQGVSSAQLRDNFDPTATTGDYAPGTYRWNREFLAVFDANGGTGTMSPIPLGPGAVAPANGFTPPENAVFDGWSTDANGNGTSYDVGAALPSTPGYGAAELALYAQWLSPKSGTAYAVLDGTGKLTLFRSKKTYYAGPDQTVTDIWGNEYTGRLYTGVESTGAQSNPPWYAYRTSVTSVDIAPDQVIAPANMYRWFADCTSLTTCDFDGIDTSNVTTMSNLFYNCRSLTQPDLGELDTSSVVNMNSMFYNCVAVPTENFDVSGFDTANVTDMSNMFYVAGNGYSPAVTHLDVSHFNTAKVTSMLGMFSCQQNLTSLDVSHFETANVTNFTNMFNFCSHVDVLDVSHFNTAKATAMDFMFGECGALTSLDVSRFDTANVEGMSNMFSGCRNLSSIDVSRFNTAKVQNMRFMFSGCSTLSSLNVTGFNTSQVTDMRAMFQSCTSLSALDVSRFDTAKVQDMNNMFSSCTSLTSLNVTGFNTAQVTDMMGMFNSCSSLTSLDVSHFDTSNVTLMGSSYGQSGYYLYGMFQNCQSLTTLDVSNFNTSKVTSMSGMFAYCYALTEVDITGFDVSSLSNAYGMFQSSHNLETIYVSPDADWSASSTLASSAEMFRYCPDLIGGNGTPYNSSYTDKSYARVDKPGQPGYFTTGPRGGTAYAVLDGNGKLTLFRSAEAYSEGAGQTVSDIRGNVYQGEVFANVENGSFGTRWAARRASIISVDVADNQIIAPDRTNEWFYGCTNMTSCDLRGLDTSNASNMSSMFNNCTALESLGVSGWNTSNVTDMCGMFGNCYSLGSGFDVSGWDVSRVSDMSQMFDGCHNASFNPDVSRWKTSSATLMSYMFRNCYGAAFAPDVSKWDTSKVTNMWYMFRNCYGAAFAPDVSKWTTTSVTDMRYMFAGCSGAAFNPDVSKWTTTSVTSMESMFSGCSGAAFNPDVSGWDVSGASNMGNMFSGCNGAAFAPDVSKWRTSSATVMSGLFQNCNTATFNPDVSDWDVSKVTNMSAMFSGCSGAAFNPDVSHWNTSSVVSMSSMFHSCNGAAFDPDVSGWNTSSVQNMYMMFAFCYGASFSPDVSGWNTSSVTNMFEMFVWCKGASFTSIDLLGWDVSNVANMQQMFDSCDNLKTIFVGLGTDWSTSPALSNDYGMFDNDTNLVGMNGTRFTYSHVDKSYARIDKPGQPGYFTSKQAVFDSNGGSGTMASITLGANVTAPECTFTAPANSVFGSWNTKSDGSGKRYDVGDLLPATGYMTLYAQWLRTDGTAYALLDETDGSLTLFRSMETVSNGASTTITDVMGNSYTGTVYTGFEENALTSPRWENKRSAIKSAKVADGQLVSPKSTRSWFDGSAALSDIDGLSILDMSNSTNSGWMFSGCYQLEDLSALSRWDMSSVTNLEVMFQSCVGVKDLSPLSGWDVSSVTTTWNMFVGCSTMPNASGLSRWNTSSLVNMGRMFENCRSLVNVSGLAGWDTSHVTDMSELFADCHALEDISGIARWDVSSVTNMNSMFATCYSISDFSALSGWTTSSLATTNNMFSYCVSMTDASALAGWDMSHATSTANMFRLAYSLADVSDLSGWNTSNVTSMAGMFEYCYSLEDISGLARWNTGNVTTLASTFCRCYSLANISALTNWNTVKVTNMSNTFQYCFSLASASALSRWKTSAVTTMTHMFDYCYALDDISALSSWTTTAVTDMSYMFEYCHSLESTSAISRWNVSNVTKMSYMFYYCSCITEVNLSNWNKSSLTDISMMFAYCPSLTKIYAAADSGSNAAHNWTVKGTTTTAMSGTGVFSSCYSLKGGISYNSSYTTYAYAKISGGYFTSISNQSSGQGGTSFAYDPSVTPTSGTAYAVFIEGTGELIFFRSDATVNNGVSTTITDIMGNTYTGIVYKGFDTNTYSNASYVPWSSKAYYIKSAKVARGQTIAPRATAWWFGTCGGLSDISSLTLTTSSTTSMANMFRGCRSLKDISALSGLNVASVRDMSGMFYECFSLDDLSPLSGWTTSSLTNTTSMFYGCYSLATTTGLANWNTSGVTNMTGMLSHCYALDDISALSGWNTSSLSNIGNMFSYCYALDDISALSNWSTSNLTKMGGVFTYCYSLDDISALSGWNTSSVTDMNSMFAYCYAIEDVTALSEWNTSSVTSMSSMFSTCYSLHDITGLANWNTGSVTWMSSMFYECYSLLDLSSMSRWNTSSVTSMTKMFGYCWSLSDISGLSNWNTESVTNMSEMFSWCPPLEDLSALSGWNVSSVTNMSKMFYQCSAIEEIDISRWDKSSLTNITEMFRGCVRMNTIYAAADYESNPAHDWTVQGTTSNAMTGTGVFTSCLNLVGGNGTAYSSSNVTYAYARIDTADVPGYFTDVANKPASVTELSPESALEESELLPAESSGEDELLPSDDAEQEAGELERGEGGLSNDDTAIADVSDENASSGEFESEDVSKADDMSISSEKSSDQRESSEVLLEKAYMGQIDKSIDDSFKKPVEIETADFIVWKLVHNEDNAWRLVWFDIKTEVLEKLGADGVFAFESAWDGKGRPHYIDKEGKSCVLEEVYVLHTGEFVWEPDTLKDFKDVLAKVDEISIAKEDMPKQGEAKPEEVGQDETKVKEYKPIKTVAGTLVSRPGAIYPPLVKNKPSTLADALRGMTATLDPVQRFARLQQQQQQQQQAAAAQVS